MSNLTQSIIYYKLTDESPIINHLDMRTMCNDFVIEFMNQDYMTGFDFDVDKIGLSIRISNCLHRSGLHTLQQVVNARYSYVRDLKNMGQKSFDELISFLKKNSIITYGDSDQIASGPIEIRTTNPVFEPLVNNDVMSDDKDDSLIIHHIDLHTMTDAYNIAFVDKNNVSYFDLAIKDSGLSVRTINCLCSIGNTMLDVVHTKYAVVKNLRYFGEKSLNELMTFLREHCIITYGSSICTNESFAITDVAKLLYDDINRAVPKTVSHYEIINVLNKYRQTVIERYESNPEDILCDFDTMTCLYNDPCFEEIANNILQCIITRRSDSYNGMSADKIKKYLPQSFVTCNKLDECLQKLVDSNIISHINDRYIYNYNSILDYLSDTDNSRCISITRHRLSGITLAEVAEKYGITRERVRQIVKKVLCKRPPVYEDRYKFIFEKYNLTKDEFCSIFDVKDHVYYYLCEIADKGDNPLSDIRFDESISMFVNMNNLDELEYANTVAYGNKRVFVSYNDIVKAILQYKHSKEPCSINVLRKEYIDFCNEKNLSECLNQADNSRNFGARLTRTEVRYTLISGNSAIRYYPMDVYDLEYLVSNIDFKPYMNCSISASKLYDNHQDLMQIYNIQNGYELHNLLRKNQNLLPDYVVLSRMPNIDIGVINRATQVQSFLYKLAPVSAENLAAAFCETYGIDENTFLANWCEYIQKYYNYDDMTYRVNIIDMTVSEYAAMRNVLNNNFYFVDEIEKLFVDNINNADVRKINSYTLHNLGFKLKGDYVIRNVYSGVGDYVKTCIVGNNSVIDMNLYSNRFRNIDAVRAAIYKLCQLKIIFEFEPNKYVSKDRFNEEQISSVDDYIKLVYEKKSKYFNIHSLRLNGFEHIMDNLGFDDWFCDSLIRDHSNGLYSMRIGGSRIFSDTPGLSIASIIEHIISDNLVMSVADLVKYFEEQYGCHLDANRVRQAVRESNLYYDENTENVYYNAIDFCRQMILGSSKVN